MYYTGTHPAMETDALHLLKYLIILIVDISKISLIPIQIATIKAAF
jgi:hypothetical protein